MTARTVMRLAGGLSVAAAAIGGPAGWRAVAPDADQRPGVGASRIVRVMSHTGDAGTTECLGFRYASDWVLTASHCVDASGHNEVITLSAQRGDVVHVQNHPTMDVSVLEVRGLASLDVAEIASPSAEPRATVIVSTLERGPGRASPPGRRRSADELRQGRGIPYHWTPSSVRVRSGSRPCRGDSGGPLLTPEGAIVGVLSRGSMSCDGRDEYVTLAPLAPWLQALTTTKSSDAVAAS